MRKVILEKLAIELMRHQNAVHKIFEDSERYTKYEILENTVDDNNIKCSKIKTYGNEGTIKEYTYYL